MKFDKAAGKNPIDQLKVVGKPVDRIDGPLKVTGTAPYAYERHDVVPNQAYGVILGAAIAKGRINAIDLSAARAAPGVIGIVTHENAGHVGVGDFYTARPLAGPAVDHYHQAVAVVVAETFEQARYAASLIRVDYARTPGAFDLETARVSGVEPKAFPDTHVGDFDTAYAAAPVKVDATYTTPDHAHVMMEPHATIAAWEGDKVTLWTSIQIVQWGLRDFAKIMGMPKENIRIDSPFIGGGFGGKATILSDAVMAALAARAVGRPVKVTLARPHLFNNTTHRAATIQRLRIGATSDGRITAFGHDAWDGNLPGGISERAPLPGLLLYAGANRRTTVRQTQLDLPEASAMRAPGEAPGLMAIEIAMDELAEKLGMDPVALRILNDTQVNPAEPTTRFTIRQLPEAFRTGAERFGWDRRSAKPGTVRDGRWLVGMGTAAAIRGGPVSPSGARVTLTMAGRILVESDMTDIGTGSYTIMGQTAAEMLGVPVDRVDVRIGDSAFPAASGSLGQRGAASATSGVYAASVKLREAIAQRMGLNARDTGFADGKVLSGHRAIPLDEAARGGAIVGEDSMTYDDAYMKSMERQTFGAHFVELGVDAMTGEVRMRRMLAVCAGGRILNPKTARSQVIGAMTMGVGAALMEELAVDKRFGFFVNHDMAGYEVPVHADIPRQDVIFLDELDPDASPMKAKGVGELGICGVAAAIANAIYNATGVRVRDYPITLDKFLDRLPAVA
ncbi:xanthine dehydrogenase family protein molybdopterin-binding subunit [Sphingomonas ginsenosidivorax]|uniref:Xanthine dehydrogenase family protein molybdopterin-binding subunit n=1 Tax=Sphingomonas ginsenosidivorax TaxID=862135 RepID=A0A5C6UIY8_9SPHN|nr:aldehyde oxidoreductase molybdenum-binding subunit PaoC [Sphingomonas ginsenosidivorax]TXC72005.1 xanthine dehydrogenase family protein molybdopterin-binding subunit [Sphingomonas ginsenosidivorax]